ncbi:DUF2256 domain-containing protein [Pseudomonas sp. BMS12]|uniref:DUF2256 domain-containing protein n=1 Tax=Pseudomonas sp. BMS12 TaxID=1796033 RepID=UPI0009EE11FF|nr:DUF2256 domain-containing protein [Pseudomonas sp. BMS12]
MKKADLPSKLCAVCGRPFSWRRKWARCWEQVRYCSQRCRCVRGARAHEATDARAVRLAGASSVSAQRPAST